MTDGPTHDSRSEKDKVRPFHAKETASGQEAADAVAAVLKHAAERDQAAKQRTPPKQTPKWMLPLGLNLGVLAVYLLIAPPGWVVVNPIAAPPEERVVQNLRTAMYMSAAKIESYRRANGRLPGSLIEAGVAADGIDYAPRSDSAFVLIATSGEEELVYDSANANPADWAGDLAQRIGR